MLWQPIIIFELGTARSVARHRETKEGLQSPETSRSSKGICICMYIYICVYIIHMGKCTYTYSIFYYSCVFQCFCMCIYIYVYIYTSAYIYIHICMTAFCIFLEFVGHFLHIFSVSVGLLQRIWNSKARLV